MNKILLVTLLASVTGFLEANPTPCKSGFGPGEQEWGFVDVRTGAHMFYWLYYVQDPKVTDFSVKPLVIWLQGGPGGSSTGFGNFEEIGPLFVNGTARPHSWAKYVNLLFIDNPVGAGFSYVDDGKYLTRNNIEIGRDMISFLKKFYSTFPKFQKSPLYIYSESYGGKMTVEIAKQLLAAIKNKEITANFQGVGLGDSWISPIDSVNTWAPFLYQTGMIDQQGQARLKTWAVKVEEALKKGKFLQATELWGTYEVEIMKETSNIDFYNILYKTKPQFKNLNKNTPVLDEFGTEELQKLMNGPVRNALKIPKNAVYDGQRQAVFNALREDFMKPVIDVVQELLDTTQLQVVVFTGNLDLIVDTPGTVEWLDKMKWKRAAEWKSAARNPIVIKNYIEGYVKNVGNLYLYWVHRAGHMVPTDNPEAALEILRRSTKFDKASFEEKENETN